MAEGAGAPPRGGAGRGGVKLDHLQGRLQRVREGPSMAAGAGAPLRDGQAKMGRNAFAYSAAARAFEEGGA